MHSYFLTVQSTALHLQPSHGNNSNFARRRPLAFDGHVVNRISRKTFKYGFVVRDNMHRNKRKVKPLVYLCLYTLLSLPKYAGQIIFTARREILT